MNKEMTFLNALEENASEFASEFSACQQEVMSHEEGDDPFMVVHDRAEQSKVHADSDKDGYQMCGIIKKNATSGVPNNYAIDFRNKVHVGSNCHIMLYLQHILGRNTVIPFSSFIGTCSFCFKYTSAVFGVFTDTVKISLHKGIFFTLQ